MMIAAIDARKSTEQNSVGDEQGISVTRHELERVIPAMVAIGRWPR